MECEKCKSVLKSIKKMESEVKNIERNIGWKIPVYALIALRELKLHVAIVKEKLESDSGKAP